MKATMCLNNELNGVELAFDAKPEKEVIAEIKSVGFRWHPKKKVWYAKQTKERLEFAEKIAEVVAESVATTVEKIAKASAVTMSLWDRCKFEEGNEDVSKYGWHTVGSNYTGLSVKDTAKVVRAHLKKRFPECKFSVTSGYSSINVTLKCSPYERKNMPELSSSYEMKQWSESNNLETKFILEYVQQLLDSYNFDDSDSMTDYFNCHFYDSVSVDREYSQTEQTEVVKNDIDNFHLSRIQYLEEQKLKQEKEFEEYQKQVEIDRQRSKEIEIENLKNKELIGNECKVNDVEAPYYITNLKLARLNKNNTLQEYIEECENEFDEDGRSNYSIETAKIKRNIIFENENTLKMFENMLLHDFDFIAGTGGSEVNDYRLTSMTDYNKMSKNERATVEWILNDCVAVYLNDEIQFVIDAQGHNYARYVALLDENSEIVSKYETKQSISLEEREALKAKAETLEDISFTVIENNNLIETWNGNSWNVYKAKLKEKMKELGFIPTVEIVRQIENECLKTAMYKVLEETETMQEQFKTATENGSLNKGDKFTIAKFSSFGMFSMNHCTFDSVENVPYAQYSDNVKLTLKLKGKRGSYISNLHEEVLVYKGWLEIPDNVLNDVKVSENGTVTTMSLFGSFDRKQYGKVMEYLKQNGGHEPIVNTYKPTF